MANGLLPYALLMLDKPRNVRSLSAGTSNGPGDPQSLFWPCHSLVTPDCATKQKTWPFRALFPRIYNFSILGSTKVTVDPLSAGCRAAHDFLLKGVRCSQLFRQHLQRTPLRKAQLAKFDFATRREQTTRWRNACIDFKFFIPRSTLASSEVWFAG